MRLKTGLQIGALFPIIMAILVSVGLYLRSQRAAATRVAYAQSEGLVEGMAELGKVTYAYLLSPDKTTLSRWETRYKETGQLLDTMTFDHFLELLRLDDLRDTHKAVGDSFKRLTDGNGDRDPDADFESRTAGNLLARMQTMQVDAFRLAKASQVSLIEAQQNTDILVATFFGIVSLLMAAGIMVASRLLMRRVEAVRIGIGKVAKGEYDHRFPVSGKDEVSDIARNLNEMTRQIKESYGVVKAQVVKYERTADALRKSSMTLSDALVKLRRAQDQIIRTERLNALGQMARGIAHNFNQSLTPVLGLSDLMLTHPEIVNKPDVLLGSLKAIKESVLKAREKMSRLSAFFQTGEDVVADKVDLNQIVRESIEYTSPRWKDQAEAEGKTVRVEPYLNDIPSIHAQPFAIHDVLVALIFNAIEAMSSGGTISITTGAEMQWVTLVVSDTGCGMNEKTLQCCFEPFYCTKGREYAGLGLTLVYGTVQRHGGIVEIQSIEGEGTVVTIKLPMHTGSNGATQTQKYVPGSLPAWNVLVVDDDEWVCRVVRNGLEAESMKVEEASGCKAALKMLREGKFDLIIADQAMPEMTGEELAVTLMKEGPKIRFILLTGFGDAMKAEGRKPDGVDLVLAKPATVEELYSGVAALAAQSTDAKPAAS